MTIFLNNYHTGVLQKVIFPFYSCYANRHWHAGNTTSDKSSQIRHKVLSVFEFIPIIGALISMCEYIIYKLSAYRGRIKPINNDGEPSELVILTHKVKHTDLIQKVLQTFKEPIKYKILELKNKSILQAVKQEETTTKNLCVLEIFGDRLKSKNSAKTSEIKTNIAKHLTELKRRHVKYGVITVKTNLEESKLEKQLKDVVKEGLTHLKLLADTHHKTLTSGTNNDDLEQNIQTLVSTKMSVLDTSVISKDESWGTV